MLSYYRQILKAAQRETCKLIREQVLIEMVIMVAALLLSMASGPSGLAKALVVFGATGGVLLAAVGLLFLWSVAWAPVNLEREDRKRIAELEKLTSNEVQTAFGLPTLATLTTEQATQLGLDEGIGALIVLPNVSVVNNSAMPVEIEAQLYVMNAELTMSLLEDAENVPIPDLERSLHRFDRRGGQLLTPFRLEPNARKLGYLVFLFGRQYVADMGIIQRRWEGIGRLRLELTNALTNTSISTQEVSKTVDELIERLEADREDSQRQ